MRGSEVCRVCSRAADGEQHSGLLGPRRLPATINKVQKSNPEHDIGSDKARRVNKCSDAYADDGEHCQPVAGHPRVLAPRDPQCANGASIQMAPALRKLWPVLPRPLLTSPK